MNKKTKCFLAAAILVLAALIAVGCGRAQTSAPVPPADARPGTLAMPNEDPNVFLRDMQVKLAEIAEQTKLNKLAETKKAAGELSALEEKLAVHLTSSPQKDELRQLVLALQAEIDKQSPNQTVIDKQMQTVNKLVNSIRSQMVGHKHN